MSDELDEAIENFEEAADAASGRWHIAMARGFAAYMKHLRASQPQPATGDDIHGQGDALAAEAFITRYRDDVREVLLPDVKRALRAGFFEGLSRARSEAEAMRRVVDAVGRSSPTEVPKAVLDAMMSLPASLRPPKGTP